MLFVGAGQEQLCRLGGMLWGRVARSGFGGTPFAPLRDVPHELRDIPHKLRGVPQTWERTMLLPHYSIRLMLIITAGCALVFLVARMAIDGASWAIAALMLVNATVLLFGIFAVLFLTAYAFAIVARWRSQPQAESPFASDKLPPQIIPPSHVDD